MTPGTPRTPGAGRPDPHPELPVDTDTASLEIPARTTRRPSPEPRIHIRRPPHLSPRHLGLALLGGTAGTAAREALSLAIPNAGGFPTTILLINIAGAFALGLLLESLLRAGNDAGGRRTLRLLVGTGFLGGFTTYSTFAVDTAQLLSGGNLASAVVLVSVTVLVGAAATWAGIAAATLIRRAPGVRT